MVAAADDIHIFRLEMASNIKRKTQIRNKADEKTSELTPKNERRIVMLYTLAVVLIVLWLLGLVSSYTMGGFIHLLLVIAIVVILLRIISGRRIM